MADKNLYLLTQAEANYLGYCSDLESEKGEKSSADEFLIPLDWDAMAERMAQSIYKAGYGAFYGGDWDSAREEIKNRYRADARAAILALDPKDIGAKNPNG